MNKKIFYGLPKKVLFCKRCVMSNQRPSSISEFSHTRERKNGKYLNFNSEGICDACAYSEIKKKKINWEKREKDLSKLLEKYRSKDGSCDCVVPGSGGKDSVYASHILKYKYNMNPLTVTWPPILYTDYGFNNFKNWIDVGGFSNISYRPNGKVMKLLTKLAIENLLHPFQTFMLGQKNLAPKIASKYGIKLIFYGESEAEYGNPIAETNTSLRDKSYFTMKNLNKIYLSGVHIKELKAKYNVSMKNLSDFFPLDEKIFKKTKMEVHYLGYYLKWTPQEAYYYAVEKTNFKARPYRTQGTYSKYNSIDDKIDDLHYYTTFIKFGIGRATYDASQEIRNQHIDRKEAMALVDRFEGEFPNKYFSEIMKYLGIKEEDFLKLCDSFRSPHLWTKRNDWVLNHNVNKTGLKD